jgi:hypothetical protein
MADIFISYSKADHALALKLSAFLEAEGWTVWWDKSLAAADLYRDEIMKQLVSARAVITIWTPNSIRSDWVRAEAGAAKKEGKLIPIKTSDVAYPDIPLPFGEMHTENLEASALIRAAVVAQLAKPAVEPSAATLLAKGFKYELLTWVGIVGGALTLFGNLDAVLKLADWARLLVQHWKEWTHAFWVWAFGWFGIHLPPEWMPLLSFLLFGSLLTIGQAVKFKNMTKNQTNVDTYQERSFRLKSWRVVVVFLVAILAMAASTVLLETNLPENRKHEIVVIGWLVAPLLIIVLFARHRLHAASSAFLTLVFFVIIAIYPVTEISNDVQNYFFLIGAPLAWILAIILPSVAPAKAVSRRLIFLALGLLLLIALNELSKFGLDVTAPKLRG